MLAQLQNHKFYEFSKLDKNVKYDLISKDEVDTLFEVLNKYYKDVFKFKPAVGYSDSLIRNKVITQVVDKIPVIGITDSDIKKIRNYVHKFLYSIVFYYLHELVPTNTSISNNEKFDIVDAYYSIFFRTMTKYVYVAGLTIPQAAFTNFLIGRLASTKLVYIDYETHYKRVKRIYKFIDKNLQDVPDKVSFELAVSYLNDYGITINKMSVSDVRDSIKKYISPYGEIMMEDPYYFLSMIYSTKIRSPLFNTSVSKYNPTIFSNINKMVHNWLLTIKF